MSYSAIPLLRVIWTNQAGDGGTTSGQVPIIRRDGFIRSSDPDSHNIYKHIYIYFTQLQLKSWGCILAPISFLYCFSYTDCTRLALAITSCQDILRGGIT
jgi:hypothetical protein